MWNRFRPWLAALSFLGMTAFFLGMLHFSPLAKWQFLPALLASSFLTAGAVLLVTFVFGRVYCSLLCPLGILQDAVNFLSSRHQKFRHRFHFQPEHRMLRYSILGLLAGALLTGLATLQVLLDPYSIYGRLVTHLLAPVYQQSTGFLAMLGEEYGFINLLRSDFIWQGLAGLLLSLAYLLILCILAWRWGRLYCNTICPVGTLLGTASRFSLFKMQIDPDKCVHCRLCEHSCRSSCINAKTSTIDTSRCVVCGVCSAVCPKDALHFTAKTKPAAVAPAPAAQGPVLSRRAMLATTATAVAVVAGATLKQKHATATLVDGDKNTVMPPGAVSQEHFNSICTACHLCIDKCPQHVLTPALLEYGLGGIYQPRLNFTHGYCDYDCHRCTEICPTGALLPLKRQEKRLLQIGLAEVDVNRCLRRTEEIECDNCVRQCPTKAITLKGEAGQAVPVVDNKQCIGCGNCEYHCPAKPPAITIKGSSKQTQL